MKRLRSTLQIGLVGLAVVAGGCARDPEVSSPSPETRTPPPELAPAMARTPATLAVAPPLDERPEGHRRLVAELDRLEETALAVDPYQSRQQTEVVSAALETLPEAAPVEQRIDLHLRLGRAHMNLGDVRAAIEAFATARAIADANEVTPNAAGLVMFHQGLGALRLGEVENCCARWNEDSCILPIRGGGLHDRPEGSRSAIRFFEEAIATSPSVRIQLISRWLLNIAYMTLDEYPAGVPEKHVLPPEQFERRHDFPRLVNVASRVGLDSFNNAGGVVLDDFDNDGLIDVLVSTWAIDGPMRFFLNRGDGAFTERSREAGLDGIRGGLNLVHADYDNDGFIDVYSLRGAWGGKLGRYPNSLLRNNGDGTFTDVTFAAGLGEVHFPSLSAAWADYDNDGDVDLYVGNETSGADDLFVATPDLVAPNQLFRNNGDGTFTDVAAAAGVENLRTTKAVTWGDYDGDRFPDLYVSNLGADNRLYHNGGDGAFTDATAATGVGKPAMSFPAWFWDFDNDGHLDLFASSYDGHVMHVAAYHVGFAPQHEPARLYRGDGRGGFVDVAATQGLTYPMRPMGANFGDLTGDGYLDFYLGTGDPGWESLMPNLLFVNRAGNGFVNVTTEGGVGHLQKGHGVAFADIDNDGDLDLFEQMGGAYPGDEAADALYENPGFGTAWIAVEVEGTTSNRAGIGARIRVDVIEDGTARSIYRHVGTGGSFGSGSLRQTIGLGAADRVERLEVFWPTSNTTQVFEHVAVGQIVRIVEGTGELRRVDVPSFRLGS